MGFVDPDEKREPDWDSFETYKGPEEQECFPAWCYKVFDVFMILLAAAIVFAISGALAFLATSRRSAISETPETAWIKFCAGGCLGVGWAARLYFGKKPSPPI
ncbi:hypothetical protein [Haloferula sp. BvORR071]|uniref:hypothetical protein n=1 Tax=Haloferula sp. BvORR071 TaxID=1396141 RepID=UPI0005567674|nr:hypothetical protein [Haloferula sp. BvORR071]